MNDQYQSLCHEDERIDDLQRNGYCIIQKKDGSCFGIDAVLLSGFANVKKGERVIDLGTGTGIIPILLEAKTEGKHFTGLEIQENIAEMAARSVSLNGLDDKITIVSGDLREASRNFGRASFDVVTSNPPYIADAKGIKSHDYRRAVSRHELLCTLEDVIREASLLLKEWGKFFMVHRPGRLAEIIALLQRYGLEPKRLAMVHPFADREANMVLIEAVKGGRAMMKVEAPIIIFQKAGIYSEKMKEKYGYCACKQNGYAKLGRALAGLPCQAPPHT